MNDAEPELESEIIYSALCQEIERDGKRVQVQIYDDGEGGWLLEVEDEHGNSTVWDRPFATDQEALDEARDAVDQDGIDSLIGPPPKPPKPPAGQGLEFASSAAELDELQRFLTDGAIESTSMDVSTLEGFLTAIAIGPRMVPPSEWFPWVWDMGLGQAEPDFETMEQANRIMSLLMRKYNGIIRAFESDPASFEPLFRRGIEHGAAQWCEGFLLGARFERAAWRSLTSAQPDWFDPIMCLRSDDGDDNLVSADEAQACMNAIVPSLVLIHAHWSEGYFPPAAPAPVRSGPKIGRNDPCACGSGKKFKKCCGGNGAASTLH